MNKGLAGHLEKQSRLLAQIAGSTEATAKQGPGVAAGGGGGGGSGVDPAAGRGGAGNTGLGAANKAALSPKQPTD